MLLEQDSRSELPVVYSETFFTDGLNVDELDQLGTDFGNNLQFLIPTSQEAQLAFTVTNNGDGTVTIDAHSDLILLDNNQTGAVIKEGEADPESLASSKPGQPRVWTKKLSNKQALQRADRQKNKGQQVF